MNNKYVVKSTIKGIKENMLIFNFKLNNVFLCLYLKTTKLLNKYICPANIKLSNIRINVVEGYSIRICNSIELFTLMLTLLNIRKYVIVRKH